LTFNLDRNAQSQWNLVLVKGTLPESAFTSWEGRAGTGSAEAGAKVQDECKAALEAAGISYDSQTVLIFCNLAEWDAQAGTFRHHSPYFGGANQTSGICFAVDSSILNVADVAKKFPSLDDQEYGKMSLGAFNSMFIGGIAHELGHAFSLPHCGARWDQSPLGTSIMGDGNRTYREERRGEGTGSFLAMASAMKLAARPLFTRCDLDAAMEPQLQTNFFRLSTNVSAPNLAGRRAALRVEGTVRGNPPIYGVIAYFNSVGDDGYFSPTATTVPDSNGNFALEVSDLAPTANGHLRIEYCHANGAVSEAQAPFGVTRGGVVDISEAQMRAALEPLGRAVVLDDPVAAEAACRNLEASNDSEAAKQIAREMAATLKAGSQPSPAEVPFDVNQLALGDARSISAEVGWLRPAANRLPPNTEVPSPFLDSGRIYATGLFAHPPSRYIFDLGGQWKRLNGEAGLETLHQDRAAGVVFVIKTDGHEAFRSPSIRGAVKTSYDVDLAGVKILELAVEKTSDGNACNWALWLDPTLRR
jgi:hypothetical protein